jgi:hypothetical protein
VQDSREAAKERQRRQREYEESKRAAQAEEQRRVAREQAEANDRKPTTTQPAYPYVITMSDGRQIECDYRDERTHYVIVKRAMSWNVSKSDVKSIRRASGELVTAAPSTQPATAPATQPAEKVERG